MIGMWRHNERWPNWVKRETNLHGTRNDKLITWHRRWREAERHRVAECPFCDVGGPGRHRGGSLSLWWWLYIIIDLNSGSGLCPKNARPFKSFLRASTEIMRTSGANQKGWPLSTSRQSSGHCCPSDSRLWQVPLTSFDSNCNVTKAPALCATLRPSSTFGAHLPGVFICPSATWNVVVCVPQNGRRPANERRPSGPLPANCYTCQSVTVASKSLKIWLELLIFVRLLLELRPEHFNISLLVAHLLAKSWPCRFDLNVGQKGVRYVVAAYVSYPSWPLVNEETVVTNRASSSGALVNFVMRLSLSGLVQPKRNSRMCSR